MKKYYTPQVEIVSLGNDDIILASLGAAENEIPDIFDIDTFW